TATILSIATKQILSASSFSWTTPSSTFTILPRRLEAPVQTTSTSRSIIFASSSRMDSLGTRQLACNPVATASGSDCLFVSVAKSDLHQRHDGIIALLAALEGQQVIVGAARARRKLAADRRAAVVNRAAAGCGIEKFAGFTEDRIRFSAQYLFALPGGRIAPLRGFVINPEVVCQPANVAPGHLNPLVNRATIGRTFGTVVIARRCGHLGTLLVLHHAFAHYPIGERISDIRSGVTSLTRRVSHKAVAAGAVCAWLEHTRRSKAGPPLNRGNRRQRQANDPDRPCPMTPLRPGSHRTIHPCPAARR